MSAIARLEETVAPRVLGKFEQNNSFRIIGGVLPGTTSSGDALVLQGLRDVDIHPDEIKLLDPLSRDLCDRAMQDFEGSRDLRHSSDWQLAV